MPDKERPATLQEPFLNALRREHIPVSVFLVNGIKLVGRIESFDQYLVLLRSGNNVVQAVFKHAISTISPARQVSMGRSEPGQRHAAGDDRERSPQPRTEDPAPEARSEEIE